MKKFILASLLMFLGTIAFSQSITGTWKTIDDKTGDAKSHVKITQLSDGTLKGEVIKILTPGRENAKCEKCKGANKDKPIQGMTIIRDMKKSGDEWTGGYILDPNSGSEYKCRIRMKDDNTLELRGYLGISLIGRNQTWQRVK